MSMYAIYDATGSITQVVSCPEAWSSLQSVPQGGGIIESLLGVSEFVLAAQYCVLGGKLLPRVAMGLATSALTFTANGTASSTISGIPLGATVMVTGVVSAGPETVTDGQLVLTSTVVGSLTVTVTFPPLYFNWSITLDAT